MKLIRLNKFIADSGKYSRRQADDLIATGRVRINGEVAELGQKIDPEAGDKVMIGRRELSARTEPHIYVMVNKPKGYIVTRAKHRGERTIYELLPKNMHTVKPVGRLDKNSTGLLILTTDGELIKELTHPKYNKDKEYLVETQQKLNEDDLYMLSSGIKLEEGNTGENKVVRVDEYSFRITLKQGWKRQIRRMLGVMDKKVEKLHRVRVGKCRIGKLPPGKWQAITREQIW